MPPDSVVSVDGRGPSGRHAARPRRHPPPAGRRSISSHHPDPVPPPAPPAPEPLPLPRITAPVPGYRPGMAPQRPVVAGVDGSAASLAAADLAAAEAVLRGVPLELVHGFAAYLAPI